MRKDRETVKEKAGYVKIQKCCEKAQRDGLQYVWLDTCCIDKRSSAELSEATNSMYRWYERSTVCYAYLADVPSEGFWSETAEYEALGKSRWFTRGWTLQELLAPRNVLLYEGNVYNSQPHILDEQRRLCSGPAQARLGSAHVCSPYLRDTAQLRLTSLEIISL
jgi:hypothetical protein